MRLDLTGDYAGANLYVPDDTDATELLHVEAGVARYLIRRIQQAEARLELTQAQLLDKSAELIATATMWSER